MIDNIIGIGTFPLKEQLVDLLPEAEKIGYTMIDSSDDYNNEEFVGIAPICGKIKIFTKFSLVDNYPMFDVYFRKQKERISKKGNEVYGYLLHWPYPYIYKKIWRKMEDLYLSGEIKEIGVCNFNVEALRKLLKDCRVKPMYNEIELHPLFQQQDIIEYCKGNGIKVISYSPFARRDKDLFGNEKIIGIAKAHHTSVSNIILKWNIQKGFIPIPSTSNIEHLKEMSLDMIEQIELSEDDIKTIDSMECGKRIRFDPETYFSKKTKIKLFLMSILYK